MDFLFIATTVIIVVVLQHKYLTGIAPWSHASYHFDIITCCYRENARLQYERRRRRLLASRLRDIIVSYIDNVVWFFILFFFFTTTTILTDISEPSWAHDETTSCPRDHTSKRTTGTYLIIRDLRAQLQPLSSSNVVTLSNWNQCISYETLKNKVI